MRPVRLLPALALAATAAVALAACSSSTQPGWTYAPPPPATPVSSAAPSGAPSGAPSAAPSVAPSAGSSGSTGGTVLPLEASGIQFVETSLEAPAGQPFQIAFDNQDQAIPHNVFIKDGSGATVFDGGAPFNGVASVTYDVPALQAGSYTYHCIVHPNMIGDLTVK